MLKILDEVCKPTKGSKYSAAIDLYAREDVVIGAGETVKVPLGVFIDENYFLMMIENKIDGLTREQQKEQFMKSHYFQLEPRSSLRAKGLIAGTGIIDLDYKDEIMIILHNPFNLVGFIVDIDEGIHLPNKFPCYEIKKGDKIAQILLKDHKTYLMGVDTEEERTGGFGSTDK